MPLHEKIVDATPAPGAIRTDGVFVRCSCGWSKEARLRSEGDAQEAFYRHIARTLEARKEEA